MIFPYWSSFLSFPSSKIFLITRCDLGLVFVAMAGPSAPAGLRLQALGAQVEFGEAVRSSRGLTEMPVHPSALARGKKKTLPQTALGGIWGQLVKGEDPNPSLEDKAPCAAVYTSAHIFSVGTS